VPQLLIPLQFLWALSLGFCKISILLLYSSVFAVPVVIWTARGAIVFIALWALATIITGCLICRPFAMNWDQTIPGGHCGDQILSFTITGVLNLITDVMVLVLPLPYLYKLQMRLYKKLVLMGVFSVGLLCVSSCSVVLPTIHLLTPARTCVVSAIRIHTLSSMNFADLTYSMPSANIFSGLEPSVAVTLACIPLLRPLLGRNKGSSGGPTPYGSHTPSKALELKSKEGGEFLPLSDDSSQYRLRPVGPKHSADASAVERSTSRTSDMEADEYEGITVRSQWAVESSKRNSSPGN
jgi:hypothetical protein